MTKRRTCVFGSVELKENKKAQKGENLDGISKW